MKYQKMINFLDNIPTQPSKFKTKNWVEINDESRGTYNEDNQIRFKTSMLSSRPIAVANTAAQAQTNNAANKKVIFINWLPFTNCMSRIKNMQVDDAHDINVVIPVHNLIVYTDNYSNHLEFYGNIVEINQL